MGRQGRRRREEEAVEDEETVKWSENGGEMGGRGHESGANRGI